MAKAFTSCITGVGRFEMVRRAALPPSLRQLMAFSGSERTMASFDLTVKVLNPITHQVEEIFSQVISQSSPRCPKVASGSATKLAASAFCRMGASRISRRLKAFPLVASGNLRRTCKVECGSRLCTGWRGLKAPTGTVWVAASNGSVRAITTRDGKYKANGASIDVNSDGIYVARDGALWNSTIGKGLLRVPYPDSLVGHHSPSDPAVQSFSERDGLTSNFSFKAIEDREGSIWIATTRGIDQFRKSVLTPVNLPQGAATYIALVADAAGRLLVGSDRLMRVTDGSAEVIDGAPTHVECAYRDPHGVIWLGGRNGLWHVSGTRFISTALPPGLDLL